MIQVFFHVSGMGVRSKHEKFHVFFHFFEGFPKGDVQNNIQNINRITSNKNIYIRFNVIGKFETMKEDVEYIGNASNLDISPSSFPRVNSHSTNSNEQKLLSLRYFQEIDEESVKKLYDIYKIDFEMFDYSVDDYLLLTT